MEDLVVRNGEKAAIWSKRAGFAGPTDWVSSITIEAEMSLRVC